LLFLPLFILSCHFVAAEHKLHLVRDFNALKLLFRKKFGSAQNSEIRHEPRNQVEAMLDAELSDNSEFRIFLPNKSRLFSFRYFFQFLSKTFNSASVTISTFLNANNNDRIEI